VPQACPQSPSIREAQKASAARWVTVPDQQRCLQRKDDLIGELRKRLAMQDMHLAAYLQAKRETPPHRRAGNDTWLAGWAAALA
jgi:hypothetical protein